MIGGSFPIKVLKVCLTFYNNLTRLAAGAAGQNDPHLVNDPYYEVCLYLPAVLQ